jgi:hypothetical protein
MKGSGSSWCLVSFDLLCSCSSVRDCCPFGPSLSVFDAHSVMFDSAIPIRALATLPCLLLFCRFSSASARVGMTEMMMLAVMLARLNEEEVAANR